ncbi:MAG: protein-glutamate O-methyltransferase family protein [Crenarchaeota archaeon]|nr:protein-glutamate O-methyltransferase family protein [Thermoproteota archaeon]
MKLTPSCLACILASRALDIEKSIGDDAERLAVFHDVVNTVNLYTGPHIELALTATMSYKRLLASTRRSIYSLEEKERRYRVAAEAARTIRGMLKTVEKEGERLRLALIASALATRMQPGPHFLVASPEPPHAVDVVGARMGIDDSDAVAALLHGSPHVFYLTGSVDELPYDEILLEILREEYGARITLVVRGSEFQNFVTKDDLGYSAARSLADEILVTGDGEATILPEEAGFIYERLKEADLLVAKGLLQTLYFYNNPVQVDTLSLLYVPCMVGERVLKVPRNTVNVVLHRRGGEEGGE